MDGARYLYAPPDESDSEDEAEDEGEGGADWHESTQQGKLTVGQVSRSRMGKANWAYHSQQATRS